MDLEEGQPDASDRRPPKCHGTFVSQQAAAISLISNNPPKSASMPRGFVLDSRRLWSRSVSFGHKRIPPSLFWSFVEQTTTAPTLLRGHPLTSDDSPLQTPPPNKTTDKRNGQLGPSQQATQSESNEFSSQIPSFYFCSFLLKHWKIDLQIADHKPIILISSKLSFQLLTQNGWPAATKKVISDGILDTS
uniref:Uncharacterized protein n=1 Tax=Globodera rostochiensis TaxID=31243 RepID=A0A914HJQ0_GLORO